MWLIRFLVVPVFLAYIATALPSNVGRTSSVTTESLIKNHNYPFEKHEVQTSDGYILTMHRIPHSRDAEKGGGPTNGLAFLLSDAGYDVWMGNARGNTYSKRHATKSSKLPPFWEFEWHDIGLYDLPAMIDYVLYRTGNTQLQYVGHSQGTTTFILANSVINTLSSRIRSAHMLAPVAWMGHMESPLAKVAGPLLGHPNAIIDLFGNSEFLPNTKAMELMGSLVCKDEAVSQVMCTNALFLIAGYNSPYLNESMIPEIMATTPAGASLNQVLHYLQEYESDYYRQYDHGKTLNKKMYGSKTPPTYDVEKIDVPIYLYYSDNDYFASLIDVDRLRYNLKPSSLKRAYRLPEKGFNHLDFLWGLNVAEILYKTLIDDIKNA